MQAQRRTAQEQYQLILECRSSGLSDYQWCMEHDIKPGTFYNWVKRLRKKACYEIPPATGRENFKPVLQQDVVKVEVIPEDTETALHDPKGQILTDTKIRPTIEIQTECHLSFLRQTQRPDQSAPSRTGRLCIVIQTT